MERENTNGPIGMFTMESSSMIWDKELETWFGMTDPITKDSGVEAYPMVKVSLVLNIGLYQAKG